MLNYLKDHFVVHHGLWSHVNLKDRCSILCRFACSLLSSCFFSFVCDLDVACCRLHCDCQPHLTHWNISTSLAPHMVVQGRDLLHQKVLKVRWPEKRKSDFVLFTLDYFSCVLGIFFNEFLLWTPTLVNILSFVQCAHVCEMQVQPCSSCEWRPCTGWLST